MTMIMNGFNTDRLDGKYLLLPGETSGGSHSVVAAIDMDSKQKVAIKWFGNVKELKKEEEMLSKFRVTHYHNMKCKHTLDY